MNFCPNCGTPMTHKPLNGCPANSEHRKAWTSKITPKASDFVGTPLDPLFDDNSSYNYMDDD